MKANVPEKIYLCKIHKSDQFDSRWWSEKASDKDIEYIRADAFIEKAAEYLMEYEFNDSPTIADRRKRVEEFRKAMKGE